MFLCLVGTSRAGCVRRAPHTGRGCGGKGALLRTSAPRSAEEPGCDSENKNTLEAVETPFTLSVRFLKGEKIPGGSSLSLPIHETACLPGIVAFQAGCSPEPQPLCKQPVPARKLSM